MCMKDRIEIVVNGKVVASHEMYLEGASPLQKIEKVNKFRVEMIDENILTFGVEFYFSDAHPQPVEEKKEVVETPVQKQVGDISNPVPPASNYNEIPIKTRKPRGPNKPKEPVVEESVFDKPVEAETVVERPVVEEKDPVVAPVKLPVVSTSTTPARINELAKLIKMWVKADGRKIEDVTIEVLNAHGASDIIENDSPETVKAGIEEAKGLMQG